MEKNEFDAAFDELLGVEGGYVNDPSDSGGATKYGITERVARANGYRGDMRALSKQEARAIAKRQYWDTLSLDAVSRVFPALAREMFDTGYNMGVGVAASFLQRLLNVLNRGGRDYSDLQADGVIGPMTIAALAGFKQRRGAEGETVLMRGMNALQGERYISLAESRQKDEAFVYGWLMHRVA